ncbi:uncharacterized protein HD556DRAFT_1314703 [Suillus plorans]|uniref:Uncharacterized protein n=1 Tax=Suillus plorans TaxID=116603 RepID=A0A9P7DAC8_9AGAM|nr:uncharacterized protein HD556DRAFT_1314703 [Suillus plorans]KAG1784908.1 hypothetical protein HD556DRAFT_1314703 [Suillus plorans]
MSTISRIELWHEVRGWLRWRVTLDSFVKIFPHFGHDGIVIETLLFQVLAILHLLLDRHHCCLCTCHHNRRCEQSNHSSSQSACLIKEEDSFPGGVHLEFDCTSLYYQAEQEEDYSDLALEAARTRRKHHMVLMDLHHRCVEVANMRLLTANLNVGRIHVERKKSGIATFIGSSSRGDTDLVRICPAMYDPVPIRVIISISEVFTVEHQSLASPSLCSVISKSGAAW